LVGFLPPRLSLPLPLVERGAADAIAELSVVAALEQVVAAIPEQEPKPAWPRGGVLAVAPVTGPASREPTRRPLGFSPKIRSPRCRH
jgi:hypothetical protein